MTQEEFDKLIEKGRVTSPSALLKNLLDAMEKQACDDAVNSGLGVGEWEAFLGSEEILAAFKAGRAWKE